MHKLRDSTVRKYDFAVYVWQLILIVVISNEAEFDGFHSRLMLLMIGILASP